MKREPFNKRAFVALTAAISGIGLPLSGLVNHQLQSHPIVLHRHAWMAAHWSLGIVFALFVVWHAILNRRVLFKHVKWSTSKSPAFSRELLSAAALVSIPVYLSVLHAYIAG